MAKKSNPQSGAGDSDVAKNNKTPLVPQTPPASEATEVDKNELVSVFNRNPPGGDFVHHVYEDIFNTDGKLVKHHAKITWRAPAREFARVPRYVADLWKKQNPNIIVDGATASKGSQDTVADSAVVKAVQAENLDLKTRLANMEKMVAELNAAKKTDE